MQSPSLKIKVFVVDDEKLIADGITTALRGAEFAVETFYDARPALLRLKDCLPDILVSDIVMPEIDGIMLALAVREQNPSCKVVLMSGNPDWKNQGHFHERDGFEILMKPFSLSQLVRLVKFE